jgi:hypothetical protein
MLSWTDTPEIWDGWGRAVLRAAPTPARAGLGIFSAEIVWFRIALAAPTGSGEVTTDGMERVEVEPAFILNWARDAVA